MNEQPQESGFISDIWQSKWESVLSAQREGMNWLFTLNLGGVAGLLTYASAKQTSACVIVGLSAFSIGLLALMFFAVAYYYAEEKSLNDFKSDVTAFRRGKFTFDELAKREAERPDKYRNCELAAWIAIVSAVVGIGCSAIAIL